MPAPVFAGFSGSTPGDVAIGAGSAEVGILVGDIDYSHESPRVDFLDRWGGIIGFARDHQAMVTLNINGEVSDIDAASGVGLNEFATVATVANEDYFATSGAEYNGVDYTGNDMFLDSVSGSQPRGGARTMSMTYLKPIGFDMTV